MDARFYQSEEIDIERLANDLVSAYRAQGYQAQQIGNNDQMLVQLKRGGDFEALVGMQAALSLTLQRTSGGVLAMIGQQRWVDKAAVGAVGILAMPVLWPLALTAGVGALRQASLGNQVLNMVDGLVRQQRPGIIPGPVPQFLLPQVQQQWTSPQQQQQTPYYIPAPRIDVPPEQQPQSWPAPMPVAGGPLRCQHCNTPYEKGDTFCSGCGRSLTPPKLYCPRCNTELKQGAAFCPKCGASTFDTVAKQAASQTPLPPPSAPSPRVTYTPPEEPAYTPPTYRPPETPVYTPPPAPSQPPVYRPIVESTIVPPTPPERPPEPQYVPPKTQNPAVQPQPKITYVPGGEKKEPQQAPQQPEVPYYVPKNQQAPAAASQPTVSYVPGSGQKDTASAPEQKKEEVYYTPPPHLQQQIEQARQDQKNKPRIVEPAQKPAPPKQSLKARPAASEGSSANTVWGKLTFSDGSEVQLQGERAVVGRYDHDLGGIRPEVDLGLKDGADTVSRIHAAIEHIGSTYTVTDLNSTNSTKLNGTKLEPDKATPIKDGDTLSFGKVTCTFKRA
uniref:FHA domain-containing protein n=1 Tax=Thermosporothrix sp. COM3 TaxID=2490863 RepID=A0A455SNZ6_9CHLR|nr:hypothetical protein KTC_41310 [Thermosporothrix sp. COM3]